MAAFLTEAHRDRYEAVVRELVPPSQGPYSLPARPLAADWAACLFLLTGHKDMWDRVAPAVDTKLRLIDWSRIRRLTLSNGQRFLVDLARFLYNGEGKPDWAALWSTLDTANFALALAALQIRRCGERILAEPKVVSDAG